MPALMYSPDAERFGFVFRWRHTVLPMVIKDPVFWFLQAWHVYWLEAEHNALAHSDGGLPNLDWRVATMAMSLLTFFVVFYGGNCYNRFYQLHANCCGIGGCMAEWSFLIKLHFDSFPATIKWNMMRLMLAGMHIHYAKLCGESAFEEKDISEAEWRAVQRNNFLSAEEVRSVRKYRGAKHFLPAIWALAEVRSALKVKLKPKPVGAKELPVSPLNPEREPDKSPKKPSAAQVHEGESALLHTPAAMAMFAEFQQVALKFRGNCGSNTNLLNMPVPFAYFHILKFMLLIALMLSSISIVEVEKEQYFISIVAFALTSMILIGLQAVAVAMSDPFGDDDLDFDVEGLMKSAYENAVATIVDKRVPCNDRLPTSIDENPLSDTDNAKRVRVWAKLVDGSSGLSAPILKLESNKSSFRPKLSPSSSSCTGTLSKGQSKYTALQEVGEEEHKDGEAFSSVANTSRRSCNTAGKNSDGMAC